MNSKLVAAVAVAALLAAAQPIAAQRVGIGVSFRVGDDVTAGFSYGERHHPRYVPVFRYDRHHRDYYRRHHRWHRDRARQFRSLAREHARLHRWMSRVHPRRAAIEHRRWHEAVGFGHYEFERPVHRPRYR